MQYEFNHLLVAFALCVLSGINSSNNLVSSIEGDGCSPGNAHLLAELWQRTFISLERDTRTLVAMEMHRSLRILSPEADSLLFSDARIRDRARRASNLSDVLGDEQLMLAYLETIELHDLALNALTSKQVLSELMLHVARSRQSWKLATPQMFSDLGVVIARLVFKLIYLI